MDILINMLHLPGMGIGIPHGIEYPIAHKVIIAWNRSRTVIASIGEYRISLSIYLQEILIDKIPNKAPLKMFPVVPDQIPIIFEISERITHSMSIFTQDKRF